MWLLRVAALKASYEADAHGGPQTQLMLGEAQAAPCGSQIVS